MYVIQFVHKLSNIPLVCHITKRILVCLVKGGGLMLHAVGTKEAVCENKQ